MGKKISKDARLSLEDYDSPPAFTAEWIHSRIPPDFMQNHHVNENGLFESAAVRVLKVNEWIRTNQLLH